MAKNTVVQKILSNHIVSGKAVPGEPVAIRIDQTLTQDATGTMAYLELEAMGIDKVKTELSVSYVDHNMMQNGPENRNDHLYLQSVAAPAPETASAIRCIWSGSAFPEKRCSAPIPIPRPTAVSA